MRFLYVLRYFFREATSNLLGTNRLNNLVSVTIITFSLFTFGLFLLTAENLGRLVGLWTENVQVNVFLQKNTPRRNLLRLESMIKVSPCVLRYRYISESEALKRFQSYYPEMSELTAELDSNPFPSSYEITIRKQFQNRTSVQELVNQLRSDNHIDDVEYDQDWIDRVQFVIRFVRIIGIFFGSILMFTATFSISNVIKLMVLSRRDEIEIMRLVGATNTFIKGPFISEGVLQGLIGGGFAIAGLFGLYQLILTKLLALRAPFFSPGQIQFLSPLMMTVLVGGGMMVGFIGSYLSLRKLLRI
jgi:cell division transport system permease protein